MCMGSTTETDHCCPALLFIAVIHRVYLAYVMAPEEVGPARMEAINEVY